jgi:hypothetical protein
MLALILASMLASQAPPQDPTLPARIQQLFHTVFAADTSSDPAVVAAESELRQLFTTRGLLTVDEVGDEASYDFLFLLCSTGPVGSHTAVLAKAVASRQNLPADALTYCMTRVKLDRLKADAMRRPPSSPALSVQIEQLFASDQAVRTVKEFDLEKMTQTDREHEPQLEAIFDRYGVPTFSLVGPDAASHFAIMIQHQAPGFRAKVLPKLKANVDAGQADASVYAMMYDRAARDAGRDQLYGENLECGSDNPTLHESPIDDPTNVNSRRAAMGLIRIEPYVRLVVEKSPALCIAPAPK